MQMRYYYYSLVYVDGTPLAGCFICTTGHGFLSAWWERVILCIKKKHCTTTDSSQQQEGKWKKVQRLFQATVRAQQAVTAGQSSVLPRVPTCAPLVRARKSLAEQFEYRGKGIYKWYRFDCEGAR
eukprot:GHVT01069060.1.p1 GENE.GHVT01069060.1~~GHVT01069060.1.p1  ORF type:complete len:125 (+),score=5.95 GHVT01069060.1:332-706(+)